MNYGISLVLLTHLESSFEMLMSILKDKSLKENSCVTQVSETADAINLLLRESCTALQELMYGRPKKVDSETTIGRAEEAFLSQFLYPEGVEAPLAEKSHKLGSEVKPTDGKDFGIQHSIEIILESMMFSTRSERGALYLSDGSGGLINVALCDASGCATSHFPLRAGIPCAVHSGGVALNAFSKFNERSCIKELDASSVLCLPLRPSRFTGDTQVSGVILLTNKNGREGYFTPDDEGIAAVTAALLYRIVNLYKIDPLSLANDLMKKTAERKINQTNLKPSENFAMSDALDKQENESGIQQVIKRVLENDEEGCDGAETDSDFLKDNMNLSKGCIEVNLARLVKEASVCRRWMSSGWEAQVTQVADTLNLNEELKEEVGRLRLRQRHLELNSDVRNAHISAQTNRDSEVLQQVLSSIRERNEHLSAIRKNELNKKGLLRNFEFGERTASAIRPSKAISPEHRPSSVDVIHRLQQNMNNIKAIPVKTGTSIRRKSTYTKKNSIMMKGRCSPRHTLQGQRLQQRKSVVRDVSPSKSVTLDAGMVNNFNEGQTDHQTTANTVLRPDYKDSPPPPLRILHSNGSPISNTETHSSDVNAWEDPFSEAFPDPINVHCPAVATHWKKPRPPPSKSALSSHRKLTYQSFSRKKSSQPFDCLAPDPQSGRKSVSFLHVDFDEKSGTQPVRKHSHEN